MTPKQIVALRFFSPQIEHGFWAWATALCFLAVGSAVGSTAKNALLKWGAVTFGVLLFMDELGQAHECFAEFTGYRAISYVFSQVVLVLLLVFLWMRENHLEKKDLKYIFFAGGFVCLSLGLRSHFFPAPFRILEELSEFLVAIIALFFAGERIKWHWDKKLVFISIVGALFLLECGFSVRARWCPRVEYWVQRSPYSWKGL